MTEPFLSEIRSMSFEFAPKGGALCNGQLLPINQNQPLFTLLGTTLGGSNGQTTFALLSNLASRESASPDLARDQSSPASHRRTNCAGPRTDMGGSSTPRMSWSPLTR
jgi:microcystin-dependent protein